MLPGKRRRQETSGLRGSSAGRWSEIRRPGCLRSSPRTRARAADGRRYRHGPRRNLFRPRARTRAGLLSARRRSEEHTSELQSRRDLVCRLLLEKKKKINKKNIVYHKKKKHKN